MPDKAIPNYPVCPKCGARFFRANDDSNHFCPQCRDAMDGINRGSTEERLEVGFAMLGDDEAKCKEGDQEEDGTEAVQVE